MNKQIKTRQEKGITLIALIITIVVLLILAVVAIRAVQGDGILAYAKNARDGYQKAKDEENVQLQNYLEILNNEGGNSQESNPPEEIILDPGLYDQNNVKLASWDELVDDYGLDISADDISGGGGYVTTSLSYILKNENKFSNVKKVVISDEEEKIAFGQLHSSTIEEIVLPNSINTLSRGAFAGCTALKSMVISNSVTNLDTSMGSGMFTGCTALESVVIENNPTSIDYWFQDCTSLKSVNIPDSVTSLGGYAFQNCTSLTSIYIPESVVEIGRDSNVSEQLAPFYGCSSSLKIYCGATEAEAEAQSGWGTRWNYYDSQNALSVTYGVTRAQYEEIVKGN